MISGSSSLVLYVQGACTLFLLLGEPFAEDWELLSIMTAETETRSAMTGGGEEICLPRVSSRLEQREPLQ